MCKFTGLFDFIGILCGWIKGAVQCYNILCAVIRINNTVQFIHGSVYSQQFSSVAMPSEQSPFNAHTYYNKWKFVVLYALVVWS